MTDPKQFDRPELTPLWIEARRRLEQGTVATLRLHNLTDAEQQALADLLGLPRLPGRDPVVGLDRLDAALRPVALDTRQVVEAIGGPVVDRRAQRHSERTDRARLWDWLATHPVVVAQPALDRWVAGMRAAGLVGGSIASTQQVLQQALAVLAALPADGRSLPTFADQVCADPHALDDGTRLATLVLRAIATLRGEPMPEGAAGRRLLWEAVGVACDALSTSVLVAGLRPLGEHPLAATLRSWSSAGQATWITLAQLRAAPGPLLTGPRVHVVENPSVIAEALARFGKGCPPLVCCLGWPNTSAILLLRRLREAGCDLAYHGDLDGEGVRITAYVIAKTGATPWRMSTTDYLARVPNTGPSVGRVTEAPWNAGLAAAMRTRGVTVSEERVVGELLDDLVAEVP